MRIAIFSIISLTIPKTSLNCITFQQWKLRHDSLVKYHLGVKSQPINSSAMQQRYRESLLILSALFYSRRSALMRHYWDQSFLNQLCSSVLTMQTELTVLYSDKYNTVHYKSFHLRCIVQVTKGHCKCGLLKNSIQWLTHLTTSWTRKICFKTCIVWKTLWYENQ